MPDSELTVEALLRLLAERDALIAAQVQMIARLQSTVAELGGAAGHELGCAACARKLWWLRDGVTGTPVTRLIRRQVFDLPEPAPLMVTEHQIVGKRCWCGAETPGAVPAGVHAPASYRPRLKAVTVS